MKLSQKSLQYKILKNIQKNNLITAGDTIIVALSGGADSTCLFDILFKIKNQIGFDLLTCHYNHRLRDKNSDRDQAFAEKISNERGVECLIGGAEKKNAFKNEEEAREGRYRFFEKILKDRRGAKVAIAHNSNDLVETLLLRLVRGSGLRGLKGIPYSRENFIRPLLYISRSEIEQYLKKELLDYINDQSNLNIEFDRNFVRHKILPLLLKLNPNLLDTLTRSISTITDEYDLLDGLTEKALAKILINKSKNQYILDRKKWKLLHPALKRLVLRKTIFEISDLKDITIKQLDEICKIIEKGEGKKGKTLPHSLYVELASGKIVVSANNKQLKIKQ